MYISAVSQVYHCRSSRLAQRRPDIIKLSQVVAVDTNIKENEGEYSSKVPTETKSYQPPRYECD